VDAHGFHNCQIGGALVGVGHFAFALRSGECDILLAAIWMYRLRVKVGIYPAATIEDAFYV
jgi:hypothetical protein